MSLQYLHLRCSCPGAADSLWLHLPSSTANTRVWFRYESPLNEAFSQAADWRLELAADCWPALANVHTTLIQNRHEWRLGDSVRFKRAIHPSVGAAGFEMRRSLDLQRGFKRKQQDWPRCDYASVLEQLSNFLAINQQSCPSLWTPCLC